MPLLLCPGLVASDQHRPCLTRAETCRWSCVAVTQLHFALATHAQLWHESCAHAALVGAQYPEFWSTWDDLGSGMILAYMLAHLQIAAARLTDHTSSTTSALLLAALSWLMSLSLRACTARHPFFPVCETEGGSCSTEKNPPSGSVYSGTDLSDTPEIIFVEDTRSDEDLLVDKAPDPWSDGMGAGEPKDWNTEQSDRDERTLDGQTMEESGKARHAGDDSAEIIFVEDTRGDKDLLVDKAPDPWSDGMGAVEPKDGNAEQSDRDERPPKDQTMEESGEARHAGDDSAMAPSEFRLPKSPADSLVCDEITRPTPPLPCNAEVLSQEEIEKGAKSEHPVSARTSNDCLQVAPSPGLNARR
jgi:hypothetical protein